MYRIVIIVITCLILQAPASKAEPDATMQKHETAGLGIGALLGGILGGPPGAMLGAAGGIALGNHTAGRHNNQARLEGQLREKTMELTRLQEQYSRTETAYQQRLQAVARQERQQTLQQLSDGIAFAVYFRTGNAGLEPHQDQSIRGIAELVRGMPSVNIQLDAHADRRGPERYNLALSRNRAENVRKLLIASGIPAKRIIVNARGESRARAQTGDHDGHALERRVDVTLTLDTRV